MTTKNPVKVCSVCDQPIEPHGTPKTGYRHKARAPRWCDAKPPVPAKVGR